MAKDRRSSPSSASRERASTTQEARRSSNTQAAALAAVTNPNQLRFARRKAQHLRVRACERLLRGVMQTQRAIRHGDDPEMAMELLMLNAQRVIRPS